MVATLYYKEGATTLSRQLFAQYRLEPREQSELTPDNPFEVVKRNISLECFQRSFKAQ